MKRRLRIVDFPEPEGPEITIGRWVCVAAANRGILVGLSLGRIGMGMHTCGSHCEIVQATIFEMDVGVFGENYIDR